MKPIIRNSCLAAAIFGICGQPAFGAEQIVFHPGETLDGQLALARSGDSVVVTWLRGIAEIDPRSIAVRDVESSSFLFPIGEGGDSFYFMTWPAASAAGSIKSLRGGESKELASSPDSEVSIAAGGRLVFTTRQAGQDVWVSDGTPAGTRRLVDVAPGWMPCGFPCDPLYNEPTHIRSTPDGRIFFVAPGISEGFASFDYWSIDPPSASGGPPPASRIFEALGDNQPGESLPTAGNRLLYVMREPGRTRLYSADGIGESRLLHVFDDPSGSGAVPRIHGLREVAGGAVFLIEGEDDRQIYFTDGSEVTAVASLGPGPFIQLERLWRHSAGYVVLAVGRWDGSEELWLSDGSAAGTRRLFTSPAGATGVGHHSFRELPGGFLIALDDGIAGREPFVSDGTVAGTRRIEDSRPGPPGSDPSHFVVFGNRIFFVGETAGEGRRPFHLDLPCRGRLPACVAAF